jgi:hypothetical protein
MQAFFGFRIVVGTPLVNTELKKNIKKYCLIRHLPNVFFKKIWQSFLVNKWKKNNPIPHKVTLVHAPIVPMASYGFSETPMDDYIN